MKKLIGAIVLVGAVASGCGGSPVGHSSADSAGGGRTGAPGYPEVDLARASQIVDWDLDDSGARDPRAFFGSKRVATVVVGTVVEYQPGPSLGSYAGDPNPQATTVVSVKVLRALKGKPFKDGNVYVQLFGQWPKSELLSAIPQGSLVVVYGSTVSPDEEFTQDRTRGKPLDADMLRPGSVGLSVVNPNGGLVFPVRGDVHRTWGLADLVPAERLPEARRAVALGEAVS